MRENGQMDKDLDKIRSSLKDSEEMEKAIAYKIEHIRDCIDGDIKDIENIEAAMAGVESTKDEALSLIGELSVMHHFLDAYHDRISGDDKGATQANARDHA